MEETAMADSDARRRMALQFELDDCESYLRPRSGTSIKTTIVYADIVGSTKLSIYLSQAELEFVIKLFWQQMSEVVRKNHGLIFKYVGDAVIALFPDDINGPHNAIECAHDMIRTIETNANPRIISMGIPAIGIKVGVDCGDALVVSYGQDSGHVDLIGFPLSMTAKITAMARPNTILAGQTLVERVEPAPGGFKYAFALYHIVTWNFLELIKRDLVYRIYSVGGHAAKRNSERLMAGQ